MPNVWLSSTVITPSLPTLSIASEIRLPISSSAAEIEATWAICSLESTSTARPWIESTAAATAASMPRLTPIGLAPAATLRRPSLHHRGGEHRRGRRAVTGDVVGLLGDLLDERGADLLVRILELDLLRDRHAVVGDRGRAPLLVEHDVAALRAERDAYGVGELVHARSRGHGVPLGRRRSASTSGVSSVGRSLRWAADRTVRPESALAVREC